MKGVAHLKKHWYVIVLIVIVAMAFTIRAVPARYNELQALDPFYLYRISEYVVTHNFQMPEVDMLRNHPYGDTQFDLLVMHYFPPIMYVLINPLVHLSFFEFALLYPAIMGALSAFIMFFLAKEIFGDKKSGIFAAFFLATVQAFITRTSAGFFEKEPTSSIFMFMSVLFFIKAFKSQDWRYGILSGIMLGIMTLSWGGSQYIYVLFAVFALVVALLNQNVRSLAYAYIPTALLGIFLPFFIQPRIVSLVSTTTLISLGVLGIIVLRIFVARFKIVKSDQMKFVTPGIVVIGGIAFLIGSMFIDFLYGVFQSIVFLLTLQPTGETTVAESVGGNWDVITGQTGLGAAMGQLPQISSLISVFSLWTFSVLGLIVVIYIFYRTRKMELIMPILWMLLSIFGVFFAIRLIYFMGPTVSLLAGFFLSWLITQSTKIKFIDDVKRTWQTYIIIGGVMVFLALFYIFSSLLIGVIFLIPALVLLFLGYTTYRHSKERSIFRRIYDYMLHKEKKPTILAIPVIIIVLFSLSFNAVNGYTYAEFLGPSINQYWYQAFDYLKYETPENSSVISWWDFGYWFQTRGNRATIVDGGGVGNTSRYDVAIWFTSDAKNWTDFEPWLKEKIDVDYILMDYTLPGKYGAITKIASKGTNIIGIMQLQQTGTFPQGNSSIFEFKNGPYAIWLPITNGAITGTPMFLISQGDQYGSPSFIQDVCTDEGIISFEPKEPSMGGCVAITSHGVYYLPEEAKYTIFSNLMFMDGYGLPLEKVFDNSLIKIYKVL